MLSRRHTRGFTLVELMVGIAIMASLLAFGMPSFSAWLQNSQIRNAAEAMQNGLHVARAEAIRRNSTVRFQLTSTLDNTCTLSTTDRNWVVSMDSAAGSCASDPTADSSTAAPRLIQKRAGTDGSANATVSADVSSVSFNGLGRASNAMTINIANASGGACAASSGPMRCLRIVVSSAGQVRMCDPRWSSSDPMGC